MLGVLNKILVDFAHGGGRFKQNAMFCDNSHGRSRNLFGSYGRGLASHIRSSRSLNKLALLSILSTLVLSSLLLNPPVITNNEASATTGTTVAAIPNLTLTNTNTSASIDIAALDPIGSFATSSSNDSATFTLTTNNTTGYTLSIAADDDNGSLLRPVDNPGDTPDSLESISTITTTSDFSARTQEAATSYNGKWGIRPSKYVDTNTTTPVDNTGDNPVYLPSPTASNPIVLDKTTAANTNNTENSYTIALGVRADHTIHAGTYSRTFKLLAVANPVSYSIAFNQNTNDTVTNMPSTQSSDAITSTTVTLPSTVPVRAHYSFLGWCNLQPTTTNGIDSCTGTNPTTGAAATVYNPNGNGTDLTYGIDHTTANNATLYAMWKIDTFTLTLTSGSNITGITASPSSANGVYNYGQTVTLTATKTTNTTCTAYATPTWSTTAGTLSSTSGDTVTITIPASNVTVTANSTASNVSQTITLSRSGGASGINIGGNNYTGSSVSLTCGTYNISGNYDSGYEFNSWSASGSASVASTSSASTTMTVSGPGTLTLAGKQSKIFFQDATSAQCGQTMYDNRGTDAYKNIAYTTASINGLCWMTRNLDLPGGTTLTADDSNVSAGCALGGTDNCTLPASSTSGFSSTTTAYVYNSNSTTCGDGSPCYSYYSYTAATAGTNPSSGEATSDICPKGWRLPTYTEYTALKNTYTTGATLTASPFYGVYAGNYNYSSFSNGGSVGYYLSSTANGASYAYSLYFNSSAADTFDYSKRFGYSVRCVLDPPFDYTISYNKNTTGAVSNIPSSQVGTANSVKKPVLSSNIPARSGYSFLGWCDNQPTTSNNTDSCSGTTVWPGRKYTINASSPNVTLYAMWEILPSLAIQNVTSSTCPTTPTKVYDTRDNEIYTIQKLADGKCWLLDNLRLDLTNSTVKANLSATNTNASNTTLNYLKNGGGTTSDKYATAGVANWTSSSSYSAPLINVASKDTAQPLAMGQSGTGKIGVYYNFCAASAGSYCYGNGTSAGTSSGNATEDICPKGWRMPTGGSSGEYQALYAAYSSDNAAFANALRAPLSGDFYNGSVGDQGSYGIFWSSARSNNSYMYDLIVGTSDILPQSRGNRNYGYSIRCILGS